MKHFQLVLIYVVLKKRVLRYKWTVLLLKKYFGFEVLVYLLFISFDKVVEWIPDIIFIYFLLVQVRLRIQIYQVVFAMLYQKLPLLTA